MKQTAPRPSRIPSSTAGVGDTGQGDPAGIRQDAASKPREGLGGLWEPGERGVTLEITANCREELAIYMG